MNTGYEFHEEYLREREEFLEWIGERKRRQVLKKLTALRKREELLDSIVRRLIGIATDIASGGDSPEPVHASSSNMHANDEGNAGK